MSEETFFEARNRPIHRKPGFDVDRIDLNAGLQELSKIGKFSAETKMVIEYALLRWARGEEAAAEKGATDPTFHGVQFAQWRRVLAAARASAEQKAEKDGQDQVDPRLGGTAAPGRARSGDATPKRVQRSRNKGEAAREPQARRRRSSDR